MRMDGKFSSYTLEEIEGVSINDLIDRGKRFTIVTPDSDDQEAKTDVDTRNET